jgi:hypothetical protein
MDLVIPTVGSYEYCRITTNIFEYWKSLGGVPFADFLKYEIRLLQWSNISKAKFCVQSMEMVNGKNLSLLYLTTLTSVI